MTSELLQKARDFEAQYGPHIPDSERPAFHATPTIGWMNDPNGFSMYKGECHLFYQYLSRDRKRKLEQGPPVGHLSVYADSPEARDSHV